MGHEPDLPTAICPQWAGVFPVRRLGGVLKHNHCQRIQTNLQAIIRGNIMTSKAWIHKTTTRIVFLLCFLVACLVLNGCSKAPPSPPLKISFRGSSLDSNTLVLEVQNTSDKHLSCKMWALNKVQRQTTDYSFSVGPYKMTEIGILECGWMFQTGESVSISTEGFADLNFKVP